MTTTTTKIPALTTVFTPAASCLTDIYNLTTASSGSDWNYLQLGPTPTSNDNCYPPDFTPISTAYYSPGVCPSGYTVACSSVVSINTISETRATCCPSQYTCQNEDVQGWAWYPTELCTYGATSTGTFLVTATPSTSTRTYIGRPEFNAYGISIRWQIDDVVSQTVSSSSVTTTTSSSITLTSQTPFTSTPISVSSLHNNNNSGLSTGAKAGIGIGAGIGVLLALFGAAFLIMYRRRSKTAQMNNSPARDNEDAYPRLPNPNIYKQGELDGSQSKFGVSELDSSQMVPVELSSERFSVMKSRT